MAGGHGGRRPGSGPKRKDPLLRSIDGGAAKRGPLPGDAEQVIGPIRPVDLPEGLSPAEREVWDVLAPFAVQKRTLTDGTALAFALLCRNVVLEQKLARHPDSAGKGDHRGMIQRVDAELLRFDLAPCGKPMYEPVAEKPANPLERFLKRQA